MFKLDNHLTLGIKDGTEYYQSSNGTIWCKPLDQSNLIGGGHEEGRNTLENPVRLQRVVGFINERPKEYSQVVLDFGCGHGMFVNYLKQNSILALGYDKFNPVFEQLPNKESVDVITCVEVIEHTQEPFDEIDIMYRCLVSGGVVMIETSFANWLTINDDYINPQAGHNTIFSHEGLTELMVSKGFKEGNHLNRNVRVYIKP